MFSTGHIIWIVISLILTIFGVLYCRRKRPSIDRLLKVCLLLGLISEVVKVLCVIEIVPVVKPVVENGVLVYQETRKYAPYIEAEHLPFELCTLQMPFMLLALTVKDEKWRKRIFALIYGTSIIGGVMALLLSSIAPEFATVKDFLLAPRAWQFFLYHAMIITEGIYIGMSEECELHFRDMKWMMLFVVVLDFATFYLNSIMTVPYYSGKELMGLAYPINYFSSYNNPLGIIVKEKWQWFIYLLIRIGIALVVTPLVFLPLRIKKHRNSDV
ncbi:MAG: YwaF family protein [Erysipelotrichaceae bacterium]|nr:YwaF family protein [Erysipelotrichaceae bacterium]